MALRFLFRLYFKGDFYIRTFRIDDSFTKNCKDGMAKKVSTLYFRAKIIRYYSKQLIYILGGFLYENI